MNAAFMQINPWSIAQMTGYIATLVVILAVSLKDEKKFTMILAGSMFAFSIHYALLAAWTSAFTTALIGFGQCLWLMYPAVSRGVKHVVSLVFLAAFSTVLFMTWEGNRSILPWLIGVNSIYAFSYLKGIRMRVQILVTTALWLVNAFAVGSIGQMITSVITLTVSAWTIHQLLKDTKRPEKSLAPADFSPEGEGAAAT